MLIFKGVENIPKDDSGYSVAIGNFDGMHLGHQTVIEIAREKSNKSSVGVVTFEPHPRQYFQKNHSIFKLMKSETRKRFLKSFEVDALFELPFDDSLANLSPRDFIETVLLEKLNVRNIVVGPDFRFGKNREGSVNLLKSYQEKKKLGLSNKSKLELSKTVEGGTVKQSFSHGRVKSVEVEVKKVRTFNKNGPNKNVVEENKNFSGANYLSGRQNSINDETERSNKDKLQKLKEDAQNERIARENKISSTEQKKSIEK